MRPLYFMIVVWGDKYRSYFSDYVLPALLAPRNLPLLSAEDGHRLLICTTEQDWSVLQTLPIMKQVGRHVTPSWIKIGLPEDMPDPVTAKFRHMTLGHRLLADAAYRDGVFGCFIAPDGMFSNGTIATVLRYAQEGVHAVLLPSLPLVEEDMFDKLRAAGVLHNASQQIILEPRALMSVATSALCSYMQNYDWESFHFAYWPSSVMWRVPNKKGILYHCSYFWYILLDFGAIDHHVTKSLDTASIENLWLSENFKDLSRVRIVQDSDEGMVFCWTPRAASFASQQWRAVLRVPILSTLWKGLRLRQMWAFHRSIGDFHKANNFRFPIRFHSAEIDEDWQAAERRTSRIMMWFFGDVFSEFVDTAIRRRLLPILHLWWRSLDLMWRGFGLLEAAGLSSQRLRNHIGTLRRAMSGNQKELAQIKRKLTTISDVFRRKSP